MNYRIIYTDELYHHGVKGMKWGVRKDERYASAKNAYRTANSEYNKAFNSAYNFSARHPISQHIKRSKNYETSNKLWSNAQDAANKVNSAKANVKDTKKQIKNEHYRDRLATRAQFKSNMNNMYAESYKNDLADLNKNGRNSKAYKNARNENFESKKSNYEWKHGHGTYDAWRALSDAYAFEANYRTTMKELRADLESKVNSNTKTAKKWASRKKDLMKMPISATTSRKDIKKVYKGK